ncbi:hypothetical protein J3E69DRAFT_346691 [Trichoderma sp. SZMC 28015]
MLPTESLGWIGFQALTVRLVGRLAPFTSRKASVGRPTRIQNDADLLDCDLHDILKTATLDVDLSVEEYHDLHQAAHGLLVSLNHMVNEEFISGYADGDGSLGDSHDIAKVSSVYPRLAKLMRFLDASNYSQFDLLDDPSASLFVLPSGSARSQAISQVAAWKGVLQRLITRSDQSQSRHDTFQPQMRLDEPKSKLHQNAVTRNPVGIIMDAIFKEFQQADCGMTHEIKLRVLDESHTDSSRSRIEMLMSCCQSGCDWQEAVCDSIQAPVNLRKKNNICIAIHETWKQRTKLRLFFDQRGLFDITDEGPPMTTSLQDYEEETLNSLFDKNMFRPISLGAYLQGLATEKRFDHNEKTSLALALARCLMVFFDKSLEHAFCNWNADSIFIMRSARSHGEPPWWHILVRSRPPTSRQSNIHDKIGPGNPILLSFAKLLLEIVHGEPIKLEVDPQNLSKNLGNWAQMCGYVEEARQDRKDSFYLHAVHGCLYLHLHLQRGQDGQNALSGTAMREVIYEQIVRNLERELHPDGLKRKRRGSFSEPGQSNKVYIAERLQLDNRHEESFTSRLRKIPQSVLSHRSTSDYPSPQILQRTSSNFSNYNSSEAVSNNFLRPVTMTPVAPPDRDHFDVAIICAIPTEYNAICQIFDKFWDDDGDPYGRAAGDLNIYTTGRIGKHNVVLALLPQMGKSNAAAAAASFRSSYNNVELALLVGVCGGVPRTDSFAEDEILLGDVVISRAVVQYDFGRKYPNGFVRKSSFQDNLGKASKNIQGLLINFGTDRGLNLLQRQTAQFLRHLQSKNRRTLTKYRYPGTVEDRLFRPDYRHKHRDSRANTCTICGSDTNAVCEEALNETCEALGCEERYLVDRKRLQKKQTLEQSSQEEAQEPAIHIGTVASGDTVLKSGEDRDKIAAKEEVIAFEMEGAGIWGEIPCIILKGVCDYADSHKNKRWQDFAAATAAAAAKALLHRYPKTEKARYE